MTKVTNISQFLEEMKAVWSRADKVEKGTADVQEYQQYKVDKLNEKFEVADSQLAYAIRHLADNGKVDVKEIIRMTKCLIEMRTAFQAIQGFKTANSKDYLKKNARNSDIPL